MHFSFVTRINAFAHRRIPVCVLLVGFCVSTSSAQQTSVIESISDAETRITLEPPGVEQSFGSNLALDGERLLIGAPYSSQDPSGPGKAHLYALDASAPGGWRELAQLTAEDAVAGDDVGFNVAFLGEWLLVGARDHDAAGLDEGALYVFAHDGANWVQIHKILPPDVGASDGFTGVIDPDPGNDRVIIGAHYWNAASGSDDGAAYIYRRENDQLVLESTLTEDVLDNEYYASGAAILGDFAFVGAYRQAANGVDYAGSVYVYRRSSDGTWSFFDRLTAGDAVGPAYFGAQIDAAIVGGSPTLLVGASLDRDATGAGYVFSYDGASWTETAKLTASDGQAGDRFGFSISLTSDEAVLGTFGSSALYRFSPDANSGASWTETEKITASDSAPIGYSVAVSEGRVATGAPRRSLPDVRFAGAAYVYGSSSANALPIVGNDTATTMAGHAVIVDVLANDRDPEGDELTITSAGPALAGEIRLLPGSGAAIQIEYRPYEGFGGTDQFPYVVSDGTGTSEALVQIDVSPPAAVLVWPGDTDNNGVVEAADVLPLAACFDLDGTARDDPTDFTWTAQGGVPWSFDQTTSECGQTGRFTDPAYADAVGDGVINQNDLLPIGVHFGSVQPVETTAITSGTDGPTSRSFSEELATMPLPTLADGDSLLVRLTVQPQGFDISGIALTLRLPEGIADPVTVEALKLRQGTSILEFFQSRSANLAREADRVGMSYAEAAVARIGASGVLPQDDFEIALMFAVRDDRPTTDFPGSVGLRDLQLVGPTGRVHPAAEDLSMRVVVENGSSPTHRNGERPLSASFELYPPFPNPFNRRTMLYFELPDAADVDLKVYDIGGRTVAHLVDGPVPAGRHGAVFDAENLASGIYLLRIVARPLLREVGSYEASRILHRLK